MNESDRLLRVPEKGFSIALDNSSPFINISLSLRVALLERLHVLGIEPGEAYEKVSAIVEDPTGEAIRHTLGHDSQDEGTFVISAWTMRDMQRMTQDRLREMQNVCQTSPAVRLVVDHVIPNLHDLIVKDNQLEEGKNLLRGLPRDLGRIAEQIIRDIDVDDEAHRIFRENISLEGGAAEMKLAHWMDLFNDALAPHYKMSVLNTTRSMQGGDVMTLAVFKVHESSKYEVPNTGGGSMDIFRVSIIDPVQHVSDTSGFWDVAMCNAFVLRDRVEHLARVYRGVVNGELPATLPTFVAHAQYMCSRYDAGNLAAVMESATLCEETKHGINGIRRLAADERRGFGSRDSKPAYARERLRDGGFAKNVYGKFVDPSYYAVATNKPVALHVSNMVEETNAKLFDMMVGPDPHHSLYEIVAHHESMTRKNPQDIQLDDKCFALMLLNMHSGRPVPPAQLQVAGQQLLKRSAEEIRLIAKRTIMNEYTESIDENPFCAVSHDGKLIRHPGTQEMFATWA
jgi:hypothetical protein